MTGCYHQQYKHGIERKHRGDTHRIGRGFITKDTPMGPIGCYHRQYKLGTDCNHRGVHPFENNHRGLPNVMDLTGSYIHWTVRNRRGVYMHWTECNHRGIQPWDGV